MRTTRFMASFLLPAACCLFPGCGRDASSREAPPVPRREVIRHVPVIPGSVLRDTLGTPEAERRSYIVLMRYDSARAFYQDTLPKLGWTIQSSQESGPERLNLYAHKDPMNVWVQMEGEVWEFGVRRTRYTVIAASGGANASATTPPQPLTPRHPGPAIR